MAVSVIPAYRVVSHFAKQSENLPAMDAVDAILEGDAIDRIEIIER